MFTAKSFFKSSILYSSPLSVEFNFPMIIWWTVKKFVLVVVLRLVNGDFFLNFFMNLIKMKNRCFLSCEKEPKTFVVNIS